MVTEVDRRQLVEEVLRERARNVALASIERDDPPGSSWRWPAGIGRLVLGVGGLGRALNDVRRQVALDVCVVGLAWLEAIDREGAE